MEWVTRVQMVLLVLLIISQFDFMIGKIHVSHTYSNTEKKYCFFSHIGTLIPGDEEKPKGFVGYDATTFTKNLWSDYHDHDPKNRDSKLNQGDEIKNFFALFGVFFPAVTGIVAGANLSGDLKDPATG